MVETELGSLKVSAGASPGEGHYLSLALPEISRAFSELNWDTGEKLRGSPDRRHWAWKFSDFSMTMLHAWIVPFLECMSFRGAVETPNNLVLEGAVSLHVERILRIQKKNGAFEGTGPNALDHGVTLAISWFLVRAYQSLASRWQPQVAERVREAIYRAYDYGTKSSEDYAWITNHQALFALSWWEGAEVFQEDRWRDRSNSVVDEIIRRQSPEGWYPEYDGADPGYQTLGTRYLALLWQRNKSRKLLDSLRLSLEYLSYCVHPDGSLGGNYGSRGTHIYYPSGLEILADTVPLAKAIADFMRQKGSLGNHVLPSYCDSMNLPILVASYLEAAKNSRNPESTPTRLPCETLTGFKHFNAAGQCFFGDPEKYIALGGRRGGNLQVFSRLTGRIVWENSGWRMRTRKGVSLTTQSQGELSVDQKSTSVELAGGIKVASELELTPHRFLLLRILNLTLFRIPLCAILLRKMIVARLIGSVAEPEGQFRRVLAIHSGRLEVRDELKLPAEAACISAESVTHWTPFHMGSSNYWLDRMFFTRGLPPEVATMEEIGQGFWRRDWSISFQVEEA